MIEKPITQKSDKGIWYKLLSILVCSHGGQYLFNKSFMFFLMLFELWLINTFHDCFFISKMNHHILDHFFHHRCKRFFQNIFFVKTGVIQAVNQMHQVLVLLINMFNSNIIALIPFNKIRHFLSSFTATSRSTIHIEASKN